MNWRGRMKRKDKMMKRAEESKKEVPVSPEAECSDETYRKKMK
jgi:hypothetical protein